MCQDPWRCECVGTVARARYMGTSAIDFRNSHVSSVRGVVAERWELMTTSASLFNPCFAYSRAKPKNRRCCWPRAENTREERREELQRVFCAMHLDE